MNIEFVAPYPIQDCVQRLNSLNNKRGSTSYIDIWPVSVAGTSYEFRAESAFSDVRLGHYGTGKLRSVSANATQVYIQVKLTVLPRFVLKIFCLFGVADLLTQSYSAAIKSGLLAAGWYLLCMGLLWLLAGSIQRALQ